MHIITKFHDGNPIFAYQAVFLMYVHFNVGLIFRIFEVI